MDFRDLLEKDDLNCYVLLTMFVEEETLTLLENDLLKRINLSVYKFRHLIDQMNEDFIELSLKRTPHFEYIEKNIIKLNNFDNYAMQAIRLKYIKRSDTFAVFEYRFIYSNQITKTKFMTDRYISRTNFYAADRNLDRIMKKSDFFHFAGAIRDREHAIRLHLFQFYYVIFNELDTPFEKLDAPCEEIMSLLEEYFHIEIAPSQYVKVSIFLRIWLLRIQNSHFLKEKIELNSKLISSYSELFSAVKNVLIKNEFKVISINEFNYVMVFLMTQGYIASQLLSSNLNLNVAEDLTKRLLEKIHTTQVIDNNAEFDDVQLKKSLFQINTQFLTFYVEPTTFISMEQVSFFIETVPLFHKVVNDFIQINRQDNILKINEIEAVNLYFSYMFVLTEAIPNRVMQDRVYICVDFSQGTLYTNYIVGVLNGLTNTHVIIETLPSNKTDIYLSDFHSNRVNIDPVIWKNPPTPSDWRVLGDLIVKKKRIKLQMK